VGLVWEEEGGYVARRGYDASGRLYSHVQGHNGRYGVYVAPWAVSDGRSQWLDGFTTVEEAIGAAIPPLRSVWCATRRHSGVTPPE
jgi:hypothetical protein